MKKFKKILLIIILIILLAVLGAVVYFGIIVSGYQEEAQKMVRDGGIEAFKGEQTSIIYDTNGKAITNLIGEKDKYYMEFDKIPYMVKRALITSEDRNFYEHSGIDYMAIMRATWELVKHKGEITQGASTITQQLARNIFLTHEVSYERKIKEMLIARELEKTYDKDTILEFYINNIYFANGYYGIQAAAKGYFSKSVEKLSLSQMVFLCSIPNNPSRYDPYVNLSDTVERRDRILKQMYDQGDIDMQLYKQAVSEKIVLKPLKHTTNNYVETYVRHCATLALMEKSGFVFEYSFDSKTQQEEYYDRYYEAYDEWSGKLYTGGYRIYTSIDMDKQKYLQSLVDETLAYYTGKTKDGVYEFQGAATCVDNETGKVVAIVGGRTESSSGYTINRAFQSHRQPGSSIKPILVYTPMLERGYTADTVVTDDKIEGGPVNSPNIFEGAITLRYAVEKSKNTIAWKLFEELTPQVGLEYLHNMNFTRIVKEDYIPAASIGGMTYGVSTVEMASAYSGLENDGVFRTSTCIKRIKDSDKNVIISNTSGEKQIYDKNAARAMTDILKGVLIRGTGSKFNISNAICAAKTGTTNENKDVWFVGYSKYYTTSVWCGYDTPQEINDGYGTICSGTIWSKFMTYIHEGLEIKDFPKQESEAGDGESTTENETQSSKESQSSSEGTSESAQTSTTESIEQTTKKETITTDTATSETTTKETTSKETTGNSETISPPKETTTAAETTTQEQTAPGGGEIYSEYWGDN